MQSDRAARLDPPAAAGLLLGALLVFQLPALPPLWLSVAALLAALAALWRFRRLHRLAWLLIGVAGTCLHADRALQQQLPSEHEGRVATVDITVEGLPDSAVDATRFTARVLAESGQPLGLVGRRLRLSWFGQPPPVVAPGERWRLAVRLRVPRGLLNPGGFDLARHALQERLVATGSVVEAEAPQRLSAGAGIDTRRSLLSQRIAEQPDLQAARFLQGLAVGDTRGLSDRDWEVLRATGLSHLLAISGLHIGLVAGFAALGMRLVYRLRPSLGLHWPLPQAAATLALLAAIAYSALAGFGLPTQRSLLMLGSVLVALLLRRRCGLGQGLALAAAAIWLFDPLALLSPGFWLSFLGVAWLLLCIPQETGWPALLGSLLRAQAAMALGLLPLTVVFFGQASLIGALLNLVAVPWVTLLVVPVLLGGLLLLPLGAPGAALLWLAGAAMALLWRLAEWAAGLPLAQLHLPEPGWSAVLLAMTAAGVLLLPRGVPGKPLAALLFLPLLMPALPRPAEGDLWVDVFDVGQGLAVLLRTREHSLLYDAGAAARGFDLGEAVVLPALRALGVGRIDRLVLSHADNDHAGGAAAVQRGLPVTATWAGEPRRSQASPCLAGDAWQWNRVRFRLLHPPAHFPELGNDSSCVLQVQAGNRRLLLPGDIGEIVEARLLRQHGAELRSDVLLVPHHGSRSSSSAEFVAAVAPTWAIVSNGHRNRFGHPHPQVRERYLAQGSELLSTAESGRLRLRLDSTGDIHLVSEAARRPRFWQRDRQALALP